MSVFHTGNPEKLPEKSEPTKMRSGEEASLRLQRIAEPRPVGDTLKEAINRATKLVSDCLKLIGEDPMSPGRAEDIWRGEVRRVWSEEMDAIRKADRDRALVNEAQNALVKFDNRIARLEALLLQDEDFNRPQVDAHRAAARGADRPVDRK